MKKEVIIEDYVDWLVVELKKRENKITQQSICSQIVLRVSFYCERSQCWRSF